MSARRPLIIRLCNWVGEATLALPALQMLEQNGYELHLVGKGWAKDLFEGHGWPVHVRPTKRAEAIAQLRQLGRTLAAREPGFAKRANTLLLTNSFSSALECRLAGLRPAGFAKEGRSLLLTRGAPYKQGAHVADEYWAAAQCLVAAPSARPNQLGLTPSARQNEEARRRLADSGVRAPFVLICPFSGPADTTGKKVWPHFRKLVDSLTQAGRTVVLCPGPGEEAQARSTFSQTVILEGIGLGCYAAISKLAAVTIANDTGPAHLAAAVGARLISVLGPDGVARWFPVGPHVTVLKPEQGWLGHDEVLRSVQQALAD